MIDTDTRQLRRGSDGLYQSGGKRKDGGAKMPCDHCGINEKCLVKPRVRCELFMPALPFQNEIGLDGHANTVRIGVAWTQRLWVGQRIALYNAKRKVIFGYARVTGMASGPIVEILEAHAHENHLMLDTPPEQAPSTLHAWQRQNYGPRIIHEKTRITAIYLQREREPHAPADQQGHEADRTVEGGAPHPG